MEGHAARSGHLTEYAVAYYERIREKYWARARAACTELREFDSIERQKVAVTNAKLYVDRAEGYILVIGKSIQKTPSSSANARTSTT